MSGNKAKDKGSRFELAIVRYLMTYFGGRAQRPRQVGFKDLGDIHLDPFVIQAKDYADLVSALLRGTEGALAQSKNSGLPYGVAVIKRRGKSVDRSYVATTLDVFRRFVVRLLRSERLLAEHAPQVYDAHMKETEKDDG